MTHVCALQITGKSEEINTVTSVLAAHGTASSLVLCWAILAYIEYIFADIKVSWGGSSRERPQETRNPHVDTHKQPKLACRHGSVAKRGLTEKPLISFGRSKQASRKPTTRSPARALSHPFFFWGRFGSPTEIDYRKKSGALNLTSLLEDLDYLRVALFDTHPLVLKTRPRYTLFNFTAFYGHKRPH